MAQTLCKADLAGFTGSQTFFRHGLNRRFLFTEGVKFFADRAGAYWLLDVLATELPALCRSEGFLAIRMPVSEHKTTLTADDGNGTVLWTKAIPWTDSPEGEWKFYLCPAEDNHLMLMLPSEY